MRKYLGLGLVTLLAVGMVGLITGCTGNSVANPCRWNVEKVMLSDDVREATNRSARNTVVLDYYAAGSNEAEFTREVELAPGQKEIIVSEIPADTEYTVKGKLYCDDATEATLNFDAVSEQI